MKIKFEFGDVFYFEKGYGVVINDGKVMLFGEQDGRSNSIAKGSTIPAEAVRCDITEIKSDEIRTAITAVKIALRCN